jgi:hypothetical protein
MPRQAVKWIFVVAALAGAVLSAYGWWFHVTVGPTHGAGAEMGILAGALTLVCIVTAVALDRRGRP